MFDYFFHWYQGAVWSNLLASVIWALPGVPGLIALVRNQKRHHRKVEESHDLLHLKLSRLEQHVKGIKHGNRKQN